MFEHAVYNSKNAQDTAKIGHSLGASLYGTPLTIFLHGEIGIGKTTFTQGLAKKLGISKGVKSPTYALENRYDEVLLHIDLFRIAEEESGHILASSETFPGVRIVEWAERLPEGYARAEKNINIEFTEDRNKQRTLTINFNDVPIPSDEEVQEWIHECMLPDHIQTHQHMVTGMAMKVADIVKGRGDIVRREALKKACQTHDMLRFVDFPDSDCDHKEWQAMKKHYGAHHEQAAAKFLAEKGYPAIGSIVITHGPPKNDDLTSWTIEQKILAYADKRVTHDKVVTLDERFDEFLVRYADGKESEFSKKWRQTMKDLEKEFCGDTPLF